MDGPKEAAKLHNELSEALGDKYQLSTPAVATNGGWLEVSPLTARDFGV